MFDQAGWGDTRFVIQHLNSVGVLSFYRILEGLLPELPLALAAPCRLRG